MSEGLDEWKNERVKERRSGWIEEWRSGRKKEW